MAMFSISHGGRSDIDKHSQTQKHKSSIEAAASSSRVTNFFKPANSDRSLKLAAKEATFGYHTAIHGQSFKLLLCTEDDNSCYRNVCKMSVVSFALAVVFIIRASRVPIVPQS